jgi:hypothetical protein
MYDELERAVTGGRPSRGLSFLGWFLIVSGLFVVSGAVVAGVALKRAVAGVEAFAREFDGRAVAAAEQVLSRLDVGGELLAMEPAAGLAFLQGMEAGDPGSAFLSNRVRSDFGGAGLLNPGAGARQGAARGGGVRLEGNEEGGFLVLGSGDEEVRFDLAKTRDGGFLTVRSPEGESRFDLERSDRGGTLTIRSDQGEVRLDLVRSDEGGTLLVESADRTWRVGVGDEAREVPRWVPLHRGMEGTMKPVYSLEGEERLLGGAAWEGSASPRDLLDFYRGRLEGDGFELEMQHGRRTAGEDEGSLWARHPESGRVVFVLARGGEGDTRALVGYGEAAR